MKYYALVILTAVSFLSCNKKNPHNAATQSHETCYEGLEADDTVRLSVIDDAGKITGTLLYENPESSNSSGTFTGIRSGDTLKLTVRTTASGTASYREKYLLKKEDKLYDGIGEIKQINDSVAVFAKPTDLVFTHSLVFEQADCSDF